MVFYVQNTEDAHKRDGHTRREGANNGVKVTTGVVHAATPTPGGHDFPW
jgi:hypothetical protein